MKTIKGELEQRKSVRDLILLGPAGIKSPPWHDMNNEDRLLHAVLSAYRKHVSGDENIGWDELGDTLHNAICCTIGDKGFIEWNEGAWE